MIDNMRLIKVSKLSKVIPGPDFSTYWKLLGSPAFQFS